MLVRLRGAGDQQPAETPVHAQAKCAGQRRAPGHALLPAGIGKREILGQPDQTITAVHRQINPCGERGRGWRAAGVEKHQRAKKQESAGLLGVDDPRELEYARTTADIGRSEEHTSELQSLMRISYAV